MEKCLKFIGLNLPVYKLSDFETNVKYHFVLNYCYDIALLIFTIVFSFLSNGYTSAILCFLAVLLSLILMHTYSLLQLLGGQVSTIEGTCKKVNASMLTFFKKNQIYGKSNIEILCNGHVYIVPVRHNSQFKEGCKVKIYYLSNNLYQKDDDTFTFIDTVCVVKEKNP